MSRSIYGNPSFRLHDDQVSKQARVSTSILGTVTKEPAKLLSNKKDYGNIPKHSQIIEKQ